MGSSQCSGVGRIKAALEHRELAVKHAVTKTARGTHWGRSAGFMLCPLMGQIAVAPRPICQWPASVIGRSPVD